MKQSRLESLIESGINILIGFGLSLVTQILIFKMYGIQNVSLSQNISITLIFTMVSLVRSYFIRRFFNGDILLKIKKIFGAMK